MAKEGRMKEPQLVVVAPCFNEGQGIEHFVSQLAAELRGIVFRFPDTRPSIVLIDDGSVDNTWSEFLRLQKVFGEVELYGLKLSRNFGHQAAICAGLDYVFQNLISSDDDTIVVMDSDGQHPPELVEKLLNARHQGYHHVQMVRQNEMGGIAKRFISPFFYRVFRLLSGLQLPNGAADFRAFSGAFLKQYLKFSESIRFNRGLFHWMGFRTKYIPYEANERLAGKTSYTFWKMMKFAFHGITYFSSKPLILSTLVTTCIGFLFCLGYGTYELVCAFNGASYVPGWLTIIFVVTLWGSLLSFGQMLMAIYIARIFDEAKNRPVYIVESCSDAGQSLGKTIDLPLRATAGSWKN
jgi:glycosyltransferase involved in cell wall biosynthesis